jgi:hypothetical protein
MRHAPPGSDIDWIHLKKPRPAWKTWALLPWPIRFINFWCPLHPVKDRRQQPWLPLNACYDVADCPQSWRGDKFVIVVQQKDEPRDDSGVNNFLDDIVRYGEVTQSHASVSEAVSSCRRNSQVPQATGNVTLSEF